MSELKGVLGRVSRVLLCATLAVTASIPMGLHQVSAAAATPTLNAYQSGDHAKLEWGVDMQSSDVLSMTAFESGQEIPNLVWSGLGNQAIVNAPGGGTGKALGITDTITNHTGNMINYPTVSTDWSISQFAGRSIPGGSTTSITFRAYSDAGTNSQLYFAIGTGWYKSGYTFNDSNGRQVLYGENVNWNSTPASFSAYVDGGTISLADGQTIVVVSSHDKNYNYGVIFYDWNAAQKKFILATSANLAPWGQTLPNGYVPVAKRDSFVAGEPLLRESQGGAWFPVRQIENNGQWATYSANVQLPTTTEYDYMTHGVIPQLNWETDGKLYIDDIKFGYATQVNLYRDSTLVYDGYLSDYDDTAAVDKGKPNPASNLSATFSNRYPQISWSPSPSDTGTTYNYQIKGIAPSGTSALSSVKPVTITSGIKGYSVVVDTNATTVPDNVIETTGVSYDWPTQALGNTYVHVATVDNQGNVSSVIHKQYRVTQTIDLDNGIIKYLKGSGSTPVFTVKTAGELVESAVAQSPYSQSAVASTTATKVNMSTNYLDTMPSGANIIVAINTTNGTVNGTVIVYDPLTLTPADGTYTKNSNVAMSLAVNNTVASIDVMGPSTPPASWLMRSASNPNVYNFSASAMNTMATGTYSISITDIYDQTIFYILMIKELTLDLDSDSGTYVQDSGSVIKVINTTATKFVSVDKTFVNISPSDKNIASFDGDIMDNLTPGIYEITFVDANGMKAIYTLTIQASTSPTTFAPNNGSYIVGSSTPLSAVASKNITSVSASGLSAGDWVVSGKTMAFNPARLDGIPSGTYIVKAILEDNSVVQYSLTVVNNKVLPDSWRASTDSFNKNQETGKFVDYEMISSVPITSANRITIGGKLVPVSSYFVIGTSIIIDKAYLATLSDDTYKITVDYNSNKVTVFYLDVSSKKPVSGSSEEIPC